MPPLTHANAYGLHKRLCKELGIDPLPKNHLRVWKGKGNKSAMGVWNGPKRMLHVYKGWHSQKDWRRTVAHETYHYYQQTRGWSHCVRLEQQLKLIDMTISVDCWHWRGRPVATWPDGWYKSLPWERGAFAYEDRMAKKYGWKD